MDQAPKRFLHVGCGHVTKWKLRGFASDEWEEVRYDIDPDVEPDIVGSTADMSAVESKSVDAIFSAHNIEHVYPHEVSRVLSEFYRILKPTGFVVITCPDLRSVCQALLRVGPDEPLYVSEGGPISALDILYGHIASVANGNEYMAHKGGFTADSLARRLKFAGFESITGGARETVYDLWLVAFKGAVPNEVAIEACKTFLP